MLYRVIIGIKNFILAIFFGIAYVSFWAIVIFVGIAVVMGFLGFLGGVSNPVPFTSRI